MTLSLLPFLAAASCFRSPASRFCLSIESNNSDVLVRSGSCVPRFTEVWHLRGEDGCDQNMDNVCIFICAEISLHIGELPSSLSKSDRRVPAHPHVAVVHLYFFLLLLPKTSKDTVVYLAASSSTIVVGGDIQHVCGQVRERNNSE
jgi:hypothetical protein